MSIYEHVGSNPTLEAMRIRLFSDIHFEFHRDGGTAFFDSISSDGVDVLVLAGDICTPRMIEDILIRFSEKFRNSQILYVAGNHEFYGSSRERVLHKINVVTANLPNVTFLNKRAVTIDGQRFIGTTLWFKHDGHKNIMDRCLNDFSQISDMYSWIEEESHQTVEFIDRELRSGDIVITHHMPHMSCVDSQFADHPSNRFFVHEGAQKAVESGLAKCWFFGHTHKQNDFMFGSTRLVSNPHGYIGYENTSRFNRDLIIDV